MHSTSKIAVHLLDPAKVYSVWFQVDGALQILLAPGTGQSNVRNKGIVCDLSSDNDLHN